MAIMEPDSLPITSDRSLRGHIAKIAELMTGAIVAGWRIILIPWSSLWRDWMLILALSFIGLALSKRDRTRSLLLSGAMAYLLGIYIVRQLPRTLELLGPGR